MSEIRVVLIGILRSVRVYVGVITNALSSLGNFAVSIALANRLEIGELGQFAIAFALYAFFTGLIRAGVCEPLLAATPDGDRLKSSTSRVSLLALVCAVGMAIGGGIGAFPYLLVTAVAIHGLSLYDYSKIMNIAAFNRRIPLIQELVWFLFAVMASLLIYAEWVSGLVGYAVWAFSGALIGYLIAAVQSFSVLPAWRLSKTDTKHSVAFGGDFLIGSGSSQIAFNLVGAVAGLAAVGSLRAGSTLLGPVSIIVGSARSLAIPFLSRGLRAGKSNVLARSWASSLIMLVTTAPFLAVIAFLPDIAGQFLLGENWSFAKPVLPYLALEMLFISLTTIPFAGFRAMLAGRMTVIIRSALAVFRIFIVVYAAMIGGAMAAAVALAIASGIGMVVWWIGYFYQLKDEEKGIA